MLRFILEGILGPGDSSRLTDGFWLLAAAAALPTATSGLWVAILAALPAAPVYIGFLVLSFLLAVLGLTRLVEGVRPEAGGTWTELSPGMAGTWILALAPAFLLGGLSTTAGQAVAGMGAGGGLLLVTVVIVLMICFLVASLGGIIFAAYRMGRDRVGLVRTCAKTALTFTTRPLAALRAVGFLIVSTVIAGVLAAIFTHLAALLILSQVLRLEADTAVQSLLFALALAGFAARAVRIAAPVKKIADANADEGSPEDAPAAEQGPEIGDAEPIPLAGRRIQVRPLLFSAAAALIISLVAAPFAPSLVLLPYVSRAADGLFSAKQSLDAGNPAAAVAQARVGIASANAELAFIGVAEKTDAGNVQDLLNHALYADPASPGQAFVRALAAAAAGDQQAAMEAATGAVNAGSPQGYLILARYQAGGEKRRTLASALLGSATLPLYAPAVPPTIPFDGLYSQAKIAGEIQAAATNAAVYAASQPLAAGQADEAFLLARPLDWVIPPDSPQYPNFMAVMGQIRWQLQDPGAAAKDFAASVEGSPQNAPWRAQAETMLLKAMSLPQVAGSVPDAAGTANVDQVVTTAVNDAKQPGSPPDLRLAAGEYMVAQRKWSDALQTLSLVSGPDQPMALAETALAYYESHDAAQAKAAATQVLAGHSPDDAQVVTYNVLGGLASAQGKAGSPEAITDFKHVVELRPAAFIAWTNLGNEYMLNGQNGFAAEAYNNAIVALYAPENQGPMADVTGNPGEDGGQWSPGGYGALANELRSEINNALNSSGK